MDGLARGVEVVRGVDLSSGAVADYVQPTACHATKRKVCRWSYECMRERGMEKSTECQMIYSIVRRLALTSQAFHRESSNDCIPTSLSEIKHQHLPPSPNLT